MYTHVCSVALGMSNSLQLYGLYLPGSCVHGIFQARVLEWVAISLSRGSFRPKDQIHIFSMSCITGRFFTHLATYETLYYYLFSVFSLGDYQEGFNYFEKDLYGLKKWRGMHDCVFVYVCV